MGLFSLLLQVPGPPAARDDSLLSGLSSSLRHNTTSPGSRGATLLGQDLAQGPRAWNVASERPAHTGQALSLFLSQLVSVSVCPCGPSAGCPQIQLVTWTLPWQVSQEKWAQLHGFLVGASGVPWVTKPSWEPWGPRGRSTISKPHSDLGTQLSAQILSCLHVDATIRSGAGSFPAPLPWGGHTPSSLHLLCLLTVFTG